MATPNTLTWNPQTGITGFNVYRKVGSAPLKGDPHINAALIPQSTPTYVDTVTADGDYFYAVTAMGSNGLESNFSNVVDKVINTSPPPAPSGLTVV